MAGENFRIERDSMGEVKVPSEAYYGAQTQRVVENFPVSGIGFPRQFIRVLDDPGWVSGRWISPMAGDRLRKSRQVSAASDGERPDHQRTGTAGKSTWR